VGGIATTSAGGAVVPNALEKYYFVATYCHYIIVSMIWFEWSDDKAANNRRKHGIAFRDATQVFNDPFAIAGEDHIESGERRWQIIGMMERVIVVLVAYTIEEVGQDEVIRLISARRATRKERIRYEQNRQKISY